MKNEENKNLKSSIKFLAEITIRELQDLESKPPYYSNINESPSKENNSYMFFDWNSWTFIEKKTA